MIYSFDEEVAKVVGVEAAVILDKFSWWIRHNESNGKNFHEGKYWTFNSTKAMEKMFPFFNMWKIGRITKKLVDDGYLITGNFNKLPFDRTLWYTLSEKGEQLLKYTCHDFAESQSDALQNYKMTPCENAKPIPVSNSVKKHSHNIYSYADAKSDTFKEAWRGFVDMRKAKKKPLTERAIKSIFKKLDEYASDDETQAKILDQSTVNCWTGVFPLRESNANGYAPSKQKKQPTQADYDEWIKELEEDEVKQG
jgi:hypothetical protein